MDALEDEDPNTLNRMHAQAIAYYEEGNMKASENLDLQVLSIRRRKLGDEHLDTLQSMHSLAVAYHEQGRLEESEQLKLQVLSIRRRKLGDEHLDTLQSMHNLAVTYSEQGRLEESEQLDLQVLLIRRRKLGDEHLDTLQSIHGLAVTYSRQGRLEESEQLHLQVLSIRRRKLGDEHLDTLQSIHGLAVTYSRQGRLEESKQLHLQVASICRCKSSDEHVDTLDSEHELAAAQQRDNLEEEKLYYTQITSPHERRLGTQLNQVLEAGNLGSPVSLAVPTQNLELPAATHTGIAPGISAETSVSDAFDYLVRHGCLDLTSQLDLSSCPEAALSGGRFGDVWCGRLLDRTQVAIKCLRLHTVDEVNSKAIKVRSRFEHYSNPRSPQQHAARELYFWSKLKHSNVLELLGFAMFQGQLAMISPWMENGTLNDHIRRHPELDRWALVRHVPTPKEPLTPFKLYQCLQISEGLEYIHEVGMVHGDLKA
ncbi:hypothetical protein FRC06_009183, partial [Ceratobasidium sp. 370]